MDLSKSAAGKSGGYKKRRLYCRVLHLQQQSEKKLAFSSPVRLTHSYVVDRRRVHPACSCWRPGRSRGRSIGDDRGRTGNLRLAKPALSRLSYVPETTSVSRWSMLARYDSRTASHEMGPGRFELPTSPLSGVRSNQLSYEPNAWRSLPLNSTPNSLNWPRMSVLYTYRVSKEQQKNRCFALPAVPISRSPTFRDGSLKQELSSYQHSLQDSCLPFSFGVYTPHPCLRNAILWPYRHPVNSFLTFSQIFSAPPYPPPPGPIQRKTLVPERWVSMPTSTMAGPWASASKGWRYANAKSPTSAGSTKTTSVSSTSSK